MDKDRGKPSMPSAGTKPAMAHLHGPAVVRLSPRMRSGRYVRYFLKDNSTPIAPALSPIQRSRLESTIRIAVVPELVHRHENDPPVLTQDDLVEIDIDGMVSLLLDRDAGSFRMFQEEIELLREAPAHVFDQFVRSVIGRVGDMWNDDTAGFYEVTLAAARLQTFVHEKVQQASARVAREQPSRRILLAKVSGEEHTLGLLVVTACFQEAGWEVSGGAELVCGNRMFRTLADGNFSVLGLSVGISVELDKLNAIIKKARSMSANPGIGICVGGPALIADRDRFSSVGADFVATDALTAVKSAEARIS